MGFYSLVKKGASEAPGQPLLIKGQVKYPMINFFYDATPVEGVRIEFYECSANEAEGYYAEHTTRDLSITMKKIALLSLLILNINLVMSQVLVIQ